MDIKDFLGYYPSITDSNFYQEIYNKKEFNDLKLNREINTNNKEYILDHQKFIARFLSPYTPYDRLLLYHEMGSGKTCSAISAVELGRKQLCRMIPAIYIANTGLHNNFYSEVVKCAYNEEYDDVMDIKHIKKYVKTKNYYVFSYTTFMAIRELKDSYVIIDEIQNIKAKTQKEHNKKYNHLLKLIQKSKNCKILLLSGKPMTDQPSEIEDKIQLLISNKITLPKLNNKGKLVLSSQFKEDFKEIVKGRISFLKNASDPKVKIKYMGNEYLENRLCICKLSANNIQADGYLKAYALDFNHTLPQNEYIWGKDLWKKQKQQKIVDKFGWSNCIEASLFVWKNRTPIISEKKGTLGGKKAIRLLQTKDIKANLKDYSIIYHTIIQKILDNKDNIHFIFSNRVNGGGALLFSQILKLFGISYIYIQDQTSIDKFNNNQSKFKVAIGTLKIAQGFTLKNINQIHIVTPNWNFAQTAQAIGRGIRLKSHNKKSTVRIFLYALVVNQKLKISVNYEQYKRSALKAYNIDLITDLLRESAVDCELFKLRNDTKGKCVGVKKQNYKEDLSTYNLYYTPYEQIQDHLRDIFKVKFILTLSQIKAKLKRYTEFSILATLYRMINNFIVIYNRWGISCYLQETNGYYFLSMTLFESNYYYTEFIKNSPPPLVDKKIINIIFKQEYQPILTLLNTKLKKISNLKKFLKNYIPSCEFEKDDNEKIMDFVFNFWNILRTELPKDKIPKKYKNVKVFIDYLRLPSGNTGKDIFNKYIKGKKLLGIIKANTLLIKDISNPQLIKTRKKSTKKRGQNYCSLSKNKLLIIFKKLNQSIDSSKSKDLQKKLRDVLIQTGQIIHEQENIELNAYMKTQNMDFF